MPDLKFFIVITIMKGSIPERVGELNSLQELLLGNNRLCGNIPDSITNLQNLTSLLLSANLFTGESILCTVPIRICT